MIGSVNSNHPAVGIDTTVPQSTRCRMEATELEQLNEYIKGKRLDVVDEVRCPFRSLGCIQFLVIAGGHSTDNPRLAAAVIV